MLGGGGRQGKSFGCSSKYFFHKGIDAWGNQGRSPEVTVQTGAGEPLKDQPVLVLLLRFTVSGKASHRVLSNPHN